MNQVQLNDIKWGSYDIYEGPYYHGRWQYELPENVTIEDKIIYAITATEGGTYDAVNMYDSCIMTLGICQWCDRWHLTTRMLGYIAEYGGVELIMKHVRDMNLPQKLGKTITFKRNRNKSWRWYLNDVECHTPEKLREIYFHGSSGKIGQWSEYQKDIARRWAVALARVWDSEIARNLQVKYSAMRVDMFAMADGKRVLLNDNSSWDGIVGATKAIYLAYAANNPAAANQQIKVAESTVKDQKWSRAWCINVIKQIVFGSDIQIWPGRYDRLRDEIEMLFDVELPKTHQDLKEWTSGVPSRPLIISEPPPPNPDDPPPVRLVNEDELQTQPINDKPDLGLLSPPTRDHRPDDLHPDDNDLDIYVNVDLTPLPRPAGVPVVEYRNNWNIFSFVSWLFTTIFAVWFRVNNNSQSKD